MGLGSIHVSTPERRDRLWLLNTVGAQRSSLDERHDGSAMMVWPPSPNMRPYPEAGDDPTDGEADGKY